MYMSFPVVCGSLRGMFTPPLASIFRPYWWLLLWAWLGVRKDSQRGWTPEKAARHNYQYLTTQTSYLSRGESIRAVRQHFNTYTFCERDALPYTRLAPVSPLLRLMPGIGWVLNTFQTRVLLLVKT